MSNHQNHASKPITGWSRDTTKLLGAVRTGIAMKTGARVFLPRQTKAPVPNAH